MLGAGVAWGVYSLRGKGVQNPASVTAGNFVRAVPFCSGCLDNVSSVDACRFCWSQLRHYFRRNRVRSWLRHLVQRLVGPESTSAATVQLSVPVLAAAGGILLLGEPITLRYVFASVAVLGGIALVIWERTHAKLT